MRKNLDDSIYSTLTLSKENKVWSLVICDVPLKLEKDYLLKDVAKFVY